MRTSTLAGLMALAASSTTAQFVNTTAPFALLVLSQNETYNGTTISPCHEGAAIEGLCIGTKLGSPPPAFVQTYTQNYSASATVDPTIGVVGYLIFDLPVSGLNESSPMSFAYNPSSNVAVPLFEPSESGQEVAFHEDQLFIPSFTNDQVTPPTFEENVFDRWYICNTNVGYNYITVAWALGDAAPQNPSCVKASIRRVFV
ncbi:hypothetical protein D0Z07_8543 [Hyphodiscus hymeniophilus]|uniref:DUF7907 domain-containing protein n=1 Tax=Hyphodiscus hymeniophilus TaxID=353542 RepID=A0A9P6SPK9_9HELO|nr:hypothetical protein D0Z07_8543 [Hyphodiscus hymeniophilus]